MNFSGVQADRGSTYPFNTYRFAFQRSQKLCYNESYELLLKLKGGEISSEVIKGFTIPVPAIFDRKLKNQTLTQLLNSE